MPNSEFDVLFDPEAWAYTKVIRKDDPGPEIE